MTEEQKSKIFFIVFGLVLLSSLAFGYWRFFIARSYTVEGRIDCDPLEQACFAETVEVECDPAQGECPETPQEETSYYKLVHKQASDVVLCDPNDEGCEPLACRPGDAYCDILFCDPANPGEDRECADIETIRAEHEAEVEEEACDIKSGDCVQEDATGEGDASADSAEESTGLSDDTEASPDQKPELQ